MTPIIDSNIWAYYFDADSQEHESVVGPVEELLSSGGIAVNTTIVMEVAHFLIKNLGPLEGGEKVEAFLRIPEVIVDLDYALATRAITLLARCSHKGIGGRDATILAAAEKLGESTIVTHDTAFKGLDWIQVLDPVDQAKDTL